MKYHIIKKHISQVQAGDTIIINSILKTVCQNDIKYCPFMGKTIFGDSYHSGNKPVEVAEIFHAKPETTIFSRQHYK